MTMKTGLTAVEQHVLAVLARTRGILPETARKYKRLAKVPSDDAMRKCMERLRDAGILAASALPSRKHMFRLSAKGATLKGVPKAWADSPSPGIAAEALSVSGAAWRPEFAFLTKAELEGFLVGDGRKAPAVPTRVMSSRFVIRTSRLSDGQGRGESRIHYWLSEMRPADELVKRVQVVTENLGAIPAFAELMLEGLFGMSIAVPNENVRASLETKSFATPTEIVVVDELKHLFPA